MEDQGARSTGPKILSEVEKFKEQCKVGVGD